MKILLTTLALLCLFTSASTAKTVWLLPLADTVIIQFNKGRGTDCLTGDRECLSTAAMAMGESPLATSHGVAKAWFNHQGRFTLDIMQTLSPALSTELQGGKFVFDADVPVPGELLAQLGREGQTIVLKKGEYAAVRQASGSYRVVF